MLRGRALALLALGVLAAPLPARAAFHFSVISELLTSYDGDADVQAVEIEMLSSGQTLTENSVLAVFDASGDYVPTRWSSPRTSRTAAPAGTG